MEIWALLEHAHLYSKEFSEDLFDRSNLDYVANKNEKKSLSEPLREYSRRKKNF